MVRIGSCQKMAHMVFSIFCNYSAALHLHTIRPSRIANYRSLRSAPLTCSSACWSLCPDGYTSKALLNSYRLEFWSSIQLHLNSYNLLIITGKFKMLNNTFVHIQGIGRKTEERFWEAGVRTWDDFRSPYPLNISAGKADLMERILDQSRANLPDNPMYFSRLLPTREHWRLFPHYQNSTAYLDIETTGMDGYGDHITTISIYDGTDIRYYVYGDNLDDFVDDVIRYDLLVTYNGKCFDIPFIENFFRIKLNKAHIDLRYILKNLGYSGGLKGCEKQFGLDRGELDGVDGYFAVLLWREYERTGNRKALETLLAYNIEDVVNLEYLMVESYNLNVLETPFYENQLPQPARPNLPFSPDSNLIDEIKARYYFSG